MLCPSCHSTRRADYEPCPYCYAPSPLTEDSYNGAHASNFAPQFITPPTMQGIDPNAAEPTSRLLVPYAEQQPVPIVRTTEFPTIHTGEGMGALVPAIPEEQQVHVPPMYTKPRPIIPRYRVISGLISFFVVIGMLCGGSIYFAQATGRLAPIEQLVNPQYQNLPPSPMTTLPVPATQIVYAANSIITSATTASSIDPSGQPQIPEIRFFVGKPIYVTYSVHPQSAGVVSFRWYTDGHFYTMSKSQSIPKVPDGTSINGNSAEIYSMSAQGKVELYWNGKLQVTLYFVVEPAPN